MTNTKRTARRNPWTCYVVVFPNGNAYAAPDKITAEFVARERGGIVQVIR